VKTGPRTEIEAVGEPAGSIMRDLASKPREPSFERFSGALIEDGEDGKVPMVARANAANGH